MIEIESLTKQYGPQLAVDNVTFAVAAGTITGFLGPNGAGKSTTLRILTGLARPTSGRATIGGRRYNELVNPALRVGVLLDAGAVHPGRTGLETLRLAARTMCLGDERAHAVLELVQLTAREGRRRVGAYSLGMRQRLGIARALLGNPEVLVLDEPANGLDPEGIAWLRALLRNHADAGGTVLLSSHLLHEVEQVADQLVVIGAGRVLARGGVTDVLADGEDLESSYLRLIAGARTERNAA